MAKNTIATDTKENQQTSDLNNADKLLEPGRQEDSIALSKKIAEGFKKSSGKSAVENSGKAKTGKFTRTVKKVAINPEAIGLTKDQAFEIKK